jgi:hypothetical protein
VQSSPMDGFSGIFTGNLCAPIVFLTISRPPTRPHDRPRPVSCGIGVRSHWDRVDDDSEHHSARDGGDADMVVSEQRGCGGGVTGSQARARP